VETILKRKRSNQLQKPFYITTPIYYVNDRPHIGHSYTTIAADLMTRFHRLNGREAFFLTGTDEHGSKVAEAAEAAGLEPQQFCDSVVEYYKKAWKALSIEYDDFLRTTQGRHTSAFRNLATRLHEAKTDSGEDVVYSGVYEGLYCTGCEKFLTEKDLFDGKCPEHNKPPQRLREKNYFFRLTAYLDRLKGLIETSQLEILPEERRREVLGLFKQGLSDFSVSREKVKWGIPLPFDETQNSYVWVEALTNYITGIGYSADEGKFRKWWYESETVHFMAKDILKFHCIYWPAILIAADLPLPDKIFLHGFFTVDGRKMSKTLGNFIEPGELVEQFGPDATRYLLLTQYPFGSDGDIQRARFVTKYNSDLANDLGNLVSRVAKMIVSSFNGKLPATYEKLDGIEEVMNEAERLPEKVIDHLHNFRITGAVEDIMALVRTANRFFDSNAPWKLVKEGSAERAGGVLYVCSEVIRIVAILLYPLMPGKSLEILSIFGQGKSILNMDNARTFFHIKPGTKVSIKKSVFPRLKEEKEPVMKEETLEGLLDITEFARSEMVVAEVLEAEKVKGADKLLKLRIDIGEEERQIVAGIAEYYTPEDVKGKRIIVVKNLKPAKVRGIESNGMLLAAHTGKSLVLVVPDGDIPVGATVS
jgi:methionyl-tRNA synthetase